MTVWLGRLILRHGAAGTLAFGVPIRQVTSLTTLLLPCCEKAKLNGGAMCEHSSWSAAWFSWQLSPGARWEWSLQMIPGLSITESLPATGSFQLRPQKSQSHHTLSILSKFLTQRIHEHNKIKWLFEVAKFWGKFCFCSNSNRNPYFSVPIINLSLYSLYGQGH